MRRTSTTANGSPSAGRSVRVLADWIVVHHLGGSVGQASGAEGQQLDLLWLDLLHWARRHRGAAWARRARAALLAGGRLRLLRLARRRESSEAIAVASAVTKRSQATAKPTTNDRGGIEWPIDGLRLPLLGPRLGARAS